VYVSWIMAIIVIAAVTFLLRRWKGVQLKRWAYLGIFFVFLVYTTRYHHPVRDYLYHVVDLLLTGVGTFLIAPNVGYEPGENRRQERDDRHGG
jgi:hypothetical protein